MHFCKRILPPDSSEYFRNDCEEVFGEVAGEAVVEIECDCKHRGGRQSPYTADISRLF